MNVKSCFGAKKFQQAIVNFLFVLLFHPVLFSNVAVLFSLNFNLSYRFVTILDLTQEDFLCQVDGYWHRGWVLALYPIANTCNKILQYYRWLIIIRAHLIQIFLVSKYFYKIQVARPISFGSAKLRMNWKVPIAIQNFLCS